MIRDRKIKEWYFTDRRFANKEIERILSVDYAHIKLANDDDLYLTKFGLPYIENLLPKNFITDKEWFCNNSERLTGTSSLYKVKTKKTNGSNIDIVLKWNRMGQEIPGGRESEEFIDAEFNSPFEEFSLVMEMIKTMDNACSITEIHKPLAIYAPIEEVEPWRIGRKEYKMEQVIKKHENEIDLNMNRSYAVIYEWIEGLDAVQVYSKGLLEEKYLRILTLDAEKKMSNFGFRVRDRKPHHVIIKFTKNGDIKKDEDGSIDYALIDFELLEMTPEKEEMVKRKRRHDYLIRQKNRFKKKPKKLHPNLSHVNILGVDYVYGRIESTKGLLWVVGKDPYLFDYFLPERWEKTQKTKISQFHDIFYTLSKDNIHIVWKISRVGLFPDADPFNENEKKILEYGYNSPFEEIAFAVKLNQNGLATIYPRAIYMTGDKIEIAENHFDKRRYKSHKNIIMPDKTPALQKNRNYITIWGFWNGPDEKLAKNDSDYYTGINMLNACREGLIDEETYLSLMKDMNKKLLELNIEDLHFRGSHLILSLDQSGSIINDNREAPEIRLCNFELLKDLRK